MKRVNRPKKRRRPRFHPKTATLGAAAVGLFGAMGTGQAMPIDRIVLSDHASAADYWYRGDFYTGDPYYYTPPPRQYWGKGTTGVHHHSNHRKHR
jgi:hypothetical protein